MIRTAEELLACFNEPLTLSRLRTIFLLLIRAHWGDKDNHGELSEELGCYIYDDESEQNSTIDISLGNVVDEDNIGKLPRISVDLGEVNFKDISIDDKLEVSEDGATTTYGKRTSTSLIIRHRAKSSDIALNMAESNAAFLIGVRGSLKTATALRTIDVKQLSKVQKEGKITDRNFFVDLMLELQFITAVSVNIESHRLKTVCIGLQGTA